MSVGEVNQSWKWAPKWLLFYDGTNQLFDGMRNLQLSNPPSKHDLPIPDLPVASFATRLQGNCLCYIVGLPLTTY